MSTLPATFDDLFEKIEANTAISDDSFRLDPDLGLAPNKCLGILVIGLPFLT